MSYSHLVGIWRVGICWVTGGTSSTPSSVYGGTQMCSELAFQYPGVILPVNFNIYGILIFHWFPPVITILQVKSKVHTPGKNERNTSRWIITTVGIHHHRCKTVEMIIIAKLYKRSPAWDNPYISCKTHSRRESSPVPISVPIQDLNWVEISSENELSFIVENIF